jgi:hypothetical protein
MFIGWRVFLPVAFGFAILVAANLYLFNSSLYLPDLLWVAYKDKLGITNIPLVSMGDLAGSVESLSTSSQSAGESTSRAEITTFLCSADPELQRPPNAVLERVTVPTQEMEHSVILGALERKGEFQIKDPDYYKELTYELYVKERAEYAKLKEIRFPRTPIHLPSKNLWNYITPEAYEQIKQLSASMSMEIDRQNRLCVIAFRNYAQELELARWIVKPGQPWPTSLVEAREKCYFEVEESHYMKEKVAEYCKYAQKKIMAEGVRPRWQQELLLTPEELKNAVKAGASKS